MAVANTRLTLLSMELQSPPLSFGTAAEGGRSIVVNNDTIDRRRWSEIAI
jgi:hypothetical protein